MRMGIHRTPGAGRLGIGHGQFLGRDMSRCTTTTTQRVARFASYQHQSQSMTRTMTMQTCSIHISIHTHTHVHARIEGRGIYTRYEALGPMAAWPQTDPPPQ